MNVSEARLARHLRDKAKVLINDKAEYIMAGNLPSMEVYRQEVGYVQALRDVMDWIEAYKGDETENPKSAAS